MRKHTAFRDFLKRNKEYAEKLSALKWSLAEQFAEIFDGFSIGSNDLTQLTLGVDRDSELLTELFDTNDPGVKKMISMVYMAENPHTEGAPDRMLLEWDERGRGSGNRAFTMLNL